MNIFDRYYTKYDQWYDKNEDVFITEINTIKKFNLQGRGVEIGTGTGRFACALGVEYGIDPSLNMLKFARCRGLKALHASGENLPYKDNYFDFALIVSSICFMQDPGAVLRETLRVLKKKGRLISAIINKNSKWGKYYSEKESPLYKEARLYTPEEIIDLYKNNGFSYTSAWQSLFNGPGEFNGKEEPRRGFDSGGFVVLEAVKC